MQRINKKELVEPKSRAARMRSNAKRSATVNIGGATIRRGADGNMVPMALGLQKIRSKITSMNDPNFVINESNRIADTLLNQMGCCVINIPQSFSLLKDQTDKERITNPNIFDPQYSTATAEKISPLTAYAEDDPFYIHDEQISRFKDYSSGRTGTAPVASLVEAGPLAAGMAGMKSRGPASLKYII